MVILYYLIYWLAAFVASCVAEGVKPYLEIEPLTSKEFGLYVVKSRHDQLNLTCTVVDNASDVQPKYNVTWSLVSSTKSSDQLLVKTSANSATLVFLRLEIKDAGQYECRASPLDRNIEPLFSSVTVNLKYRRECGDAMFACSLSSLQNCIPRRFKCDGYRDCQMGEDEDQNTCGEIPCFHKLPCKDLQTSIIRCIPQAWCCKAKTDPNCTIKEPLSCCSLIFHQNFMNEREYFGILKPPHYNEMSMLQPAIYAIIGCVVVFMMVVTVLVIAIYRVRVYMRVQYPPVNLRQESNDLSQNMALHDLDVFYNRGCGVDSCPPGLLVTYNINNGVQIVGVADQPPPYSEIMMIPPKEGPPPPYSSVQETEALLQQPETTTTSQRADNQRQGRGEAGLSSQHS